MFYRKENHLLTLSFSRIKNYFKAKYLFLTILTIILSFLLYDDFYPQNTKNKDENTLVVGMECNYKPYNYLSNNKDKKDLHPLTINGKESDILVAGYDVLVAKELIDYLNAKYDKKIKLVIKKIDFDSLIPACQNGDIDLIIAGMSKTKERQDQIDFTDNSYYDEDQFYVIVINKNNPNKGEFIVNDKIQLPGKMLYQRGTFYEQIAKTLKGNEVEGIDNFDVQAQKVQTDSKYFYLADATVAQKHLQTHNNLDKIEMKKEIILDNKIKQAQIIEKDKETALYKEIKQAAGILAIGFQKQKDINKEFINNKQITKEDIEDFLTKELTSDKRKEFMYKQTSEKDTLNIWSIFKNNFSLYKRGILTTLKFGIYGTFGGFVLSLLLVLFQVLNITKKKSHFLIYYLHQIGCRIINFYIWIIKSTPMLVQAFVSYFFLKEFAFFQNATWYTPMFAAYMVIILNTMGYISEIITKNISFLDKGQIEASLSLGMTHTQTMRYIVLPQAIKRSQTPILNEFIINLKDCVVFSMLGGIIDIACASNALYSSVASPKPYYISSIIYLIIVGTVIFFLKKMEKVRQV
ncbi:transporter substrate-binding domain-containing protein [Paulownia witches'-broom phytoplasma]|uniref:Transporter substrate-binding domain-containing protein n=1 Tax=Paulownia witches'-broom phytoplasma TaxID=39647 RepID=A0ABX8TPL4_9MOLU|nr:transporter substrate-binding domain-containing protein [Paulownia witches'-broom phytoplasma]GLH60433.1 amino acid ABC transporter substrate-binding protein [Paulownia witches'-broom phytoplasma]